jgi:hypothetical protein
MLSNGELVDMRADGVVSLPDVCTIMMAVESSDGMGSQLRTWSVRASGVACRLSPMGVSASGERVSSGRLTSSETWTLTVPAGTVLVASDRVVVDGVTYEVAEDDGARSWDLFVRVSLVLVQ